MRDILPQEMALFRRIEAAFRDVCDAWGYAEVRTPTIEHLYLFTSAGTLSPQMLDRVYSFLDWDGWSGERVVLRPDSTIAIARLYAEQMSTERPVRLSYIQSVLRFAEGDESREDWQCGVELIGGGQPSSDVELMVVACDVIERLGLSPRLGLSDPGVIRALLVKAGLRNDEQLALYDRLLDGDLDALDEVQLALPDLETSLRALLTVEDGGSAYLANLRSALETAVPEVAGPLDELATVAAILTQVGIDYSISPLLARNFEYYTGPAFSVYVRGERVGAGGRYDLLMSLVGGVDSPASGFGLDVEAISRVLGASPKTPRKSVAIRAASGRAEDIAAAFTLARTLRDRDLPVQMTDGNGRTLEPAVVASGEGFYITRETAGASHAGGVEEAVRVLTESIVD